LNTFAFSREELLRKESDYIDTKKSIS